MRVIFGVRFYKDNFVINSSLCYIELLVVILFNSNFKCMFLKGRERERE